jgi:hypothetical protein
VSNSYQTVVSDVAEIERALLKMVKLDIPPQPKAERELGRSPSRLASTSADRRISATWATWRLARVDPGVQARSH